MIERDLRRGFFDDDETVKAIDEIASASRLTLFVGAGASADQKLPRWDELVRDLLGRRLAHDNPRLASGKIELIVDALASLYREVPIGSIVDGLYRDQLGETADSVRNQDIHEILYPSDLPRSNVLVTMAEYIVELALAKFAQHCDIHIVTTNYDDNIESAAALIADSPDSPAIVPITSAPADGFTGIPVVHIHGRVSSDGTAEGVVLSEGDYAGWSGGTNLREYLTDRFQHGITLFVGTSLRDQNVLELVYVASKRLATNARRIALMPIQDEVSAASKNGVSLPKGTERYAVIRGTHLGIDILRPDFFGQVKQFLHETSLHASAKASGEDAPPAYKDRIRDWWKVWHRKADTSESGRRTGTVALQDLAEELMKMLGKDIGRVKLEVWVRSHPWRRQLEMWYSTQSLWVYHRNYWPHVAPISHDAQYASIAAFAARNTVFGQVAYRHDGRWTHFFALPILLPQGPFLELPVGVITMLVWAPRYRQRKTPPSLSDEGSVASITRKLSEAGQALLSPPYSGGEVREGAGRSAATITN